MIANISGSSVAEIKLNMIELKLDRLIEEMRFLKSHTIAFDTRLRGIEAYLKASEPSEQQPESKITPWLAAALGDALLFLAVGLLLRRDRPQCCSCAG